MEETEEGKGSESEKREEYIVFCSAKMQLHVMFSYPPPSFLPSFPPPLFSRLPALPLEGTMTFPC